MKHMRSQAYKRKGFLFLEKVSWGSDPTFHPDADPDPDPTFPIKAQTFEKALQEAHVPYILAGHLQIDAYPVPDPAYHLDADPDADPDPDFYLMRMRIRITKTMRIRFHNTARSCSWTNDFFYRITFKFTTIK